MNFRPSGSIPLSRPDFSAESRARIADDVQGILASGKLMMGPFKDRFEEAVASMSGQTYAVSVNSCTTALTICLEHFGARGREVLVPAGSFLTDVTSVIASGGVPVLVDLNPRTLALDPNDLQRKLTSRTAGLIWVHLTGVISSEHDRIVDFARKNDLFVIEDASHAHGAMFNGRAAGSFGDAACFSFYPTKIVTSGTGGAIATSDPALKKFAEEMRLFGKDLDTGEITRLGNDWFLDELRACIGWHQLQDLPRQLVQRRQAAADYQKQLSNQPGLSMIDVPTGQLPAWYQFPVFLAPELNRQELSATLKEKYAIETKAIYKPTHHETVLRSYGNDTLRNTERTLDHSLCLPMYSGLMSDEIDYISNTLISEIRSRMK